MQKHEQYGTSMSLAMSADATCRGLRSASDGPFIVQFNKGLHCLPNIMRVGWVVQQENFGLWPANFPCPALDL